MMDLESSGTDFNSIMPASNTIQPDTSAPTSNPTMASLDATSSSHPCMSTSPPLLSHANTPAPSPATCSLPNTPPISPAHSLLNSPACFPTLNNVVPFSLLEPSPISPTHFPVNSAPIPPTLSHVNELPISPPEPSILEPAGGDHRVVRDSESATVEIGSKKRGRGSKKKRREVENDAPLKRTKPLNTDATIASGGRMCLSASTSTATWRSLRSDTQATKQGGNKAAIATTQWHSKTVGMSAPPPTGSSSAIVPVEAEENSPLRFSRTVVMLQSESAMGEKWMELVRIWALFEVWSRYKEVSKLGPMDRLAAVGEWIG